MDPNRELTPDDFTLVDDGTMDTVVRLPNGEEWRYMDAADYRDATGALDFERWVRDVVIPDCDADASLWEAS
jgi:hypothetical protein